MVPMRDVLHIRLNTNKQFPRPMMGQSPLEAALADIGLGAAITGQQMRFYQNEARPSAVLSTDLVLDKEQVAHLRDRWDEQSKGMRQGNTPILTAGLKVQPWASGGRQRNRDCRYCQDEQGKHRARVPRAAANPRAWR